jgi:hypothetical protein
MSHCHMSAGQQPRVLVTRSVLLPILALAAVFLSTTSPVLAARKPRIPPVAVPGACPSGKPVQHFTVDITGNISTTGRTFAGPLCIDVAFDPAVQFVQIEGVVTTVKGPDPSSVFLGSSSTSGGEVKVTKAVDAQLQGKNPPKTLPEVVAAIEAQAHIIGPLLDAVKSDYLGALRQENTTIDKLTAINKALRTTNADSLDATLKNQYLALKPDLAKALAAPKSFNPTDLPSKVGDVYLDEIQQLETRLAHLPLEFVSGTAKPVNTQECTKSMDTDWTDWNAVCKDSYFAPVKQELDADLAAAQLYTSTSDAATALKKPAAIVQYWDTIFTGIGLATTMGSDDIKAAPLTGLSTHVEIPCDGLFNENISTVLNLVTLDYTPTLTGGDPTQKAQSSFVTVTCSTRFTISGGVGFSTIEQKTFAIVPGSDGKGGSVNVFGTTNDSKVTPVALAVANVRLSEWKNHGVGLYGSLGVGGNLETSASTVYFLPGMSFAFWRTMYITLGAGIGSQSVLTGGYKLGDIVPTGVTTIGAVTGSSHTACFAFAITFTKP